MITLRKLFFSLFSFCFLSLLIINTGLCAELAPTFKLYDEGKEEIVNYEKYGTFQDAGKEGYKYKIKDVKGLALAVGEGIYPNSTGLAKDPEFIKCKKKNKLSGSHWAFVNTPDYQANFYRWSTAAEDPGVKLFYTAHALENAGQIAHAIKAYYALVVHFPRSIGTTYWGTPWYVGTAALDRILYLTRNYPQLGLKLVDARITINNRFDNLRENDIFFVDPGRLIKAALDEDRKSVV